MLPTCSNLTISYINNTLSLRSILWNVFFFQLSLIKCNWKLSVSKPTELSLLERHMTTSKVYKRREEEPHYDNRVLTKLLRNYRSHPDILKLPNEMFYDDELEVHADKRERECLCGWEKLPNKVRLLNFLTHHKTKTVVLTMVKWLDCRTAITMTCNPKLWIWILQLTAAFTMTRINFGSSYCISISWLCNSFVWERLAVASLAFLSPCGSLSSSLDGKFILTDNAVTSICFLHYRDSQGSISQWVKIYPNCKSLLYLYWPNQQRPSRQC